MLPGSHSAAISTWRLFSHICLVACVITQVVAISPSSNILKRNGCRCRCLCCEEWPIKLNWASKNETTERRVSFREEMMEQDIDWNSGSCCSCVKIKQTLRDNKIYHNSFNYFILCVQSADEGACFSIFCSPSTVKSTPTHTHTHLFCMQRSLPLLKEIFISTSLLLMQQMRNVVIRAWGNAQAQQLALWCLSVSLPF